MQLLATVEQDCDTLYDLQKPKVEPTPSFRYFLPSPFLTCCAILPISFGGKEPHLRR